jgi:hypothetical protein
MFLRNVSELSDYMPSHPTNLASYVADPDKLVLAANVIFSHSLAYIVATRVSNQFEIIMAISFSPVLGSFSTILCGQSY